MIEPQRDLSAELDIVDHRFAEFFLQIFGKTCADSLVFDVGHAVAAGTGTNALRTIAILAGIERLIQICCSSVERHECENGNLADFPDDLDVKRSFQGAGQLVAA